MPSRSLEPVPRPVSVYLNEGLRIAAILLAWAVVAAVFTFGVSQIGTTGSLFASVGPGLGLLFAVTGVLNAVLYVSLRSIDYWQTA